MMGRSRGSRPVPKTRFRRLKRGLLLVGPVHAPELAPRRPWDGGDTAGSEQPNLSVRQPQHQQWIALDQSVAPGLGSSLRGAMRQLMTPGARILVVALALSVTGAVGCGGDNDETTEATGGTEATGETEATGGTDTTDRTLDVADVRFRVADVKVAGTSVTVDLEPIKGNPNNLTFRLIGGDGKQYKAVGVQFSPNFHLLSEYNVPPAAQGGAKIEAEKGGATDTVDLGLD
jgi:hypothetical protein